MWLGAYITVRAFHHGVPSSVTAFWIGEAQLGILSQTGRVFFCCFQWSDMFQKRKIWLYIYGVGGGFFRLASTQIIYEWVSGCIWWLHCKECVCVCLCVYSYFTSCRNHMRGIHTQHSTETDRTPVDVPRRSPHQTWSPVWQTVPCPERIGNDTVLSLSLYPFHIFLLLFMLSFLFSLSPASTPKDSQWGRQWCALPPQSLAVDLLSSSLSLPLWLPFPQAATVSVLGGWGYIKLLLPILLSSLLSWMTRL